MDLLELIKKGDMLETAVVGDMAHKPAYFVPGNSVLGKFTWLLFLMNTEEPSVL
ncbi:hypothetical protein HanRHA438_Chr16g0780871 [Helianthus annuus]|nr:hypothetical protein HanRHA438_Chr16g0780871 [Helianthus annuus]